jgi:hypothetical protein
MRSTDQRVQVWVHLATLDPRLGAPVHSTPSDSNSSSKPPSCHSPGGAASAVEEPALLRRLQAETFTEDSGPPVRYPEGAIPQIDVKSVLAVAAREVTIKDSCLARVISSCTCSGPQHQKTLLLTHRPHWTHSPARALQQTIAIRATSCLRDS